MPYLMGMTRMVLALLLLTGCVGDVEPPPYDVYLVDVPDAHRARWEAAVAAWNEEVGHEVLVLRSEAPMGRCGVRVSHVALGNASHGDTLYLDECRMRVRYGTPCVAAHELGHVLGLLDVDVQPVRSVMHAWDCPVPMPTAEDGAAVRERWDLGR